MKLSGTATFVCLLVSPFVVTVSCRAQAPDQHPLLDKLAAKVIQEVPDIQLPAVDHGQGNQASTIAAGTEDHSISEERSAIADNLH